MKYIKYLHKWIKYNGFKISYKIGYFDTTQVIHIIGPLTFYKNLKIKKMWIDTAKAAKAKYKAKTDKSYSYTIHKI